MEGGSSASSMPRSISIDGFMVPVTTKRSVSAPKDEDSARPLHQKARAGHVSDNRVISYSYHAPGQNQAATPVEMQTASLQSTLQSVPSDSLKENKLASVTPRLDYLLLCSVLIFGGITLIMATLDIELKPWLLLIYAAIVIVFRAPSAVVFGCAFFALTMVPITEIMNKTLLSESYAVYSFLLLTLGTFIAIFELKKEEPTKGFKW